jgi:hypothetical protein
MKIVQGIRIFSRKKNPVFKLGGSKQFKKFSQVEYQNHTTCFHNILETL